MTQYNPTAEKNLCPTCGQVLPINTKVEIKGSFLFFEGERIRLSPKEKLIMEELISGLENGYTVTPYHLIESLYPNFKPANPKNNLHVFISELKRKFRNTNIRLTNEYNVYRLSFI